MKRLQYLALAKDFHEANSEHPIELLKNHLERNEPMAVRFMLKNCGFSRADKNIFLSTAADKGYTEIVEQMLEFDADVDTGFSSDYPSPGAPLNLALKNGHFDTVEVLLANGANIKYINMTTYSCVIMQEEDGEERAEKLLTQWEKRHAALKEKAKIQPNFLDNKTFKEMSQSNYMVLAARTNYFGQISDKSIKDPIKNKLTYSDFLKCDDTGNNIITIVASRKKLHHIFKDKLWIGRLDEAQKLWQNHVPASLKRHFDFKSFEHRIKIKQHLKKPAHRIKRRPR